MLLVPGFVVSRLDVANRMQVRQSQAQLIFQLFGQPVGFDERMRVGNLNMDIHMPVRA